jgi:hypothetical protein
MTKRDMEAAPAERPSASGSTVRQHRWSAAYFIEGSPVHADEVARDLWNDQSTQSTPMADRDVVLEQYKLYVELTDRVSQRRGLANTFFLTLNTAIMTAIGVFWNEQASEVSDPWLIFPLVALLTQCLAWFWTIRSYRQLNRVKWAVVGALESRLPASPWWRAEWAALDKGQNPARYWPLTHVEQTVPLVFAGTYLAAFIAVLAT